MSNGDEGAGDVPMRPEKKQPWTPERWLGVINLVLIVITAALTVIGWVPKWELDRIAVEVGSQKPTIPSGSLSIDDLGPLDSETHCYAVHYDVSTKNLSTRPITITYAIAQLFVGDRKPKQLSPGEAYVMNDVPNLWDRNSNGQIAWNQVAYDADIIDGTPPNEVVSMFQRENFSNQDKGGGITGIVAPGDTTEEAPYFVVRAKPNQYIGVAVSYGLDSSTTSPSPKIGLTSDYKHLDDVGKAQDANADEAREYCNAIGADQARTARPPRAKTSTGAPMRPVNNNASATATAGGLS